MIDSPFGKIRSAILSFGELSNAYIWLEASEENVQSATLNYRINGAKKWMKQEDTSYPFEFSVPLENKANQIEWWIEAKTGDNAAKSNNTLLKR